MTQICHTSFGFIIGNSPVKTTTPSSYSRTTLSETPNDINDQIMSARNARIMIPLSTMTSTLMFSLIGNPSPSNAGIGSVIPFDVSRKEQFSGSIGNSVVMLRLQMSLRKRGYLNKKANVATFKPKDDLGVLLNQGFGSGSPLVEFNGSTSGLDEYLQSCEGNQKKALIFYGQDVDIAPNGDVSSIVGEDLKSTEELLYDKIGDRALDVTLLGGVTIHRAKEGGKDAGEDCFLPCRIMGVRSRYKVDIFEEVFGDLPTSRQTLRIR